MLCHVELQYKCGAAGWLGQMTGIQRRLQPDSAHRHDPIGFPSDGVIPRPDVLRDGGDTWSRGVDGERC